MDSSTQSPSSGGNHSINPGHPDRFAYNLNGDGAVDWHTSASVCLERAHAMLDMVNCYVSEIEDEGQGFAGLGQHTLGSITDAVQVELRDVGKLLDGWHNEQWRKERKKS